MAEIISILSRIENIFNEIQLDYVIVGGLAAIIKGRARTTTDIDLIIENDSEKINRFLERLKENNFEVLDEQVKWAFKENTNASIFDKLSVMRLDIKIAKKSIDKEALDKKIFEPYKDLTLKVASVEYILLDKIWFLGDISDIPDSELLEYNDVLDFLNVYLNNKEKCNFAWLEKRIASMNLSSTLHRLISFSDNISL